MKTNIQKKLLLGILLGITGSSSHACRLEGKIVSITTKKNTATATFDNGRLLSFDKNGIYMPVLEKAAAAGNPVCISNLGYDPPSSKIAYPTQVVINVDVPGTDPEQPPKNGCIKDGKIKRIIVNMNYAWFYLQDQFVMRLKHWSRKVPALYDAAVLKKDVCVTVMDLDSSGPDWGIPRKINVNGKQIGNGTWKSNLNPINDVDVKGDKN